MKIPVKHYIELTMDVMLDDPAFTDQETEIVVENGKKYLVEVWA